MSTVFMHGSGRDGLRTWGEFAEAAELAWTFQRRHPDGDDPLRDAARLLEVLAPNGGHVVAASYGALAALLAANQAPDLVRSLALLEPACFATCLQHADVTAYVAAMSEVFVDADNPAVSHVEFSRRFAHAAASTPPAQHLLEDVTARLRALRPPWEVAVSAVICRQVPTLVLTSGTSPLYEAVAASLSEHGARHEILPGVGHRIADHYRVVAVTRTFWSESSEQRIGRSGQHTKQHNPS